MRADITSEADCEASARAAVDHYGKIDGLYANAGIEGAGSAEDCTLEQWRRVIDINLTGAWLSARSVLPAMRAQRRGSIVLTGSVAGLVGFPAGAAYAAAKGGVIALARQMTADYAPDGVRGERALSGHGDDAARRAALRGARRAGGRRRRRADRADDEPLPAAPVRRRRRSRERRAVPAQRRVLIRRGHGLGRRRRLVAV